MTDYEGLGTPSMHTYVGRVAEGQAVLDTARAAMRLPGSSLDPHGPVAFWGYSQGGGATASAAELASSYAPELHIVSTYAGAPPADLKELLPYADGSALSSTKTSTKWSTRNRSPACSTRNGLAAADPTRRC